MGKTIDEKKADLLRREGLLRHLEDINRGVTEELKEYDNDKELI